MRRVAQIAFWILVAVMAVALVRYIAGSPPIPGIDEEGPRIVLLVALLAVLGTSVLRGPVFKPALIWAAIFAAALGVYALIQMWQGR